MSAAVAARFSKISKDQGPWGHSDQENWQQAENEVLQPLLSCGVLESKEEAVITLLGSALGSKDIDEVEVCAEPHRLILVGKRSSTSGSSEVGDVYSVLPLADEIDPSSIEPRTNRRGSIIEIRLHKRTNKPVSVARAA